MGDEMDDAEPLPPSAAELNDQDMTWDDEMMAATAMKIVRKTRA